MSDIVLSQSVRSNLLNLQQTADLISQTQNRLSTGKKVNSALDNPTNFFTASSLNSRANDLSNLLDGLSNGIKTLEAADNGLKAITNTVETLQSTVRQARQDKSFKTASYDLDLTALDGGETIQFSGGAVGSTPVSVELTGAQGTFTGSGFAALDFDSAADNSYAGTLDFDVAIDGGTAQSIAISATDADTLSITVDGGAATTFDVADVEAVTVDELAGALNAAFTADSVDLTASTSGGELVLTSNIVSDSGTASVAVSNVAETLAGASDSGLGGGAGGTSNIAAKSLDQIITAINGNASLDGKIRASSDNGKLRIENQSTSDLTVTGVNALGDLDGETGTATVGGNQVRKNLADQFNDLRNQLDRLSDDSGFNGVNLLRGDRLRLSFNENGTSSIDIQAKDSDGNVRAINSSTLGIDAATAQDFESDAALDAALDDLGNALTELRTQSSAFGSNLSSVQNRQDFTKATINTLRTGADNLTLADINEEAANLLALQTRQQLSNTALSLASQADQSVLRLL